MLNLLPPDPIFALQAEFVADKRKYKQNMALGILMDEKGSPFVLSSVADAFKTMKINTGYLPMKGDLVFLDRFADFFELDNGALQQTVGGTHAVGVFQRFLAEVLPEKIQNWHIGAPMWGNYESILHKRHVFMFPHVENGKVCVEKYIDVAKKLKQGDVLLLQGTKAHNPTGKNLNIDDLKAVLSELHEDVWIYVDTAYAGLAEGFKKDKNWLQFVWNSHEKVGVGISFSKNATLYGHRLGFLAIKSEYGNEKVESQLQNIVRKTISTVPRIGSDILNWIYENQFTDWQEEVEKARILLNLKRATLQEQFLAENKMDFARCLDGFGLFAVLPYQTSKILELKQERGIYMLENGRVNVSGVVIL